ncbi:hypothetical protein MNBD_ACTINO02-2797 [hydrothermal vent metagenome]|uniref:DUF3152 domain-containing protein n=1 Tax=hydrothermal vent metagenome TaxID=652676 RepID=A0A3B0SWH9_9ZZZZ
MLRRWGAATTALVMVLTIAGAGLALADDITVPRDRGRVAIAASLPLQIDAGNGLQPSSRRRLTASEREIALFFGGAGLLVSSDPSPGPDCAGLPPLYCTALPDVEPSVAVLAADQVGINTDETITRLAAGCLTAGPSTPASSTTVVDRNGPLLGTGERVYKYRIEVEDGLPVDPGCLSTYVGLVLGDRRSWIGARNVSFQQTSGSDYNFRIVFASPNLTDRLCLPLRTGGKLSCRSGNRVVLNFMRWESGGDAFGDDLATYRTYLLNHEVGHRIGKNHRSCGGVGEPAPVMAQQTKGVGACTANGWPLEREL